MNDHEFECFVDELTRVVHFMQIWVPSNPRGAEMLPPSFVEAESDLYLRRLWGLPKDVRYYYIVSWFCNDL